MSQEKNSFPFYIVVMSLHYHILLFQTEKKEAEIA